jgi:DNA-binding transcriptional LysR family regulator
MAITKSEGRMSLLSVSPRRLQVFASVVEAGGFGAAAAVLDISQPSISAHVRELERQVGVELFERQPGTTPQLSPAGRLVYDYARDAIERANALAAQLGRTATTVRFAAQRFAASSLLTLPLEAFSAACPRVELVARTGTFEEVLALFTSGAVDLAFMLTAGEEVPGIQTTSMGRYRLAFIATPSHPLAKCERIPVETVARHPFISAVRSSYFGRTLERILQAAGFPTPLHGSQAEELSMVRNMVLAGMGISLSLRRSVQQELAEGRLVELDVDVDPMYLVLKYARSKRARAPEIDQLIELIQRSERQAS